MQINVSLTYLYTFLDTPPVVIGMDGTPTRWIGLIITLCRFDWEFSCNVQMFVQCPDNATVPLFQPTVNPYTLSS